MNRPLNPQQVLAYRTDIGSVGSAAGVAGGNVASFPVPSLALEMSLYVERGIRPSAALMALLCGDHQGALALGGPEMVTQFGAAAAWMYDNLPVAAQGSLATVERWMAMHAHPKDTLNVPSFDDWRAPQPGPVRLAD